ncbi:clavaminate synthase family protein [Micromonospora zamorensis]|uniref:clavaminate synthase family protein n=1 Tax=Micromonospora zamorensis TaxID=709883 RepID=UPI00340B7927
MDDIIMVLNSSESQELDAVAQHLCKQPGEVDSDQWVASARTAWETVPTMYRSRIRAFRRGSGPSGVLVIRGLHVHDNELPNTPATRGSVQRVPSVPAALLLMTACGLGDPAAFLAEKSGALVQDVVPVPGQEEFQGNAGSVDLMMHNENAFHLHRPDFVMLLCLRADHEGTAGLRTASIRRALPLLSDRSIDTLARPEFSTQAPPSFGGVNAQGVQHPVLLGDKTDPDIKVDFAATHGLTLAAREALAELDECLDKVAITIRLGPGDLAVADNRVCLHGRTAFQPRYDGRDRWLQRTFAFADLRRSRDYRTGDGYVLMR